LIKNNCSFICSSDQSAMLKNANTSKPTKF
jgi:hypothetical protein